MDEIPLTSEIIEFFVGHERSAEDAYFSSLEEPERERVRDALDEAQSHLSDREMVVVGFSISWKLTDYRVAQILGLSREGVRKIKNRAVEKLRMDFFAAIKKSVINKS